MPDNQEWQSALTQSFANLSDYLVTHVPHIVGAAFLLIIGWVVAWFASKVAGSAVSLAGHLWRRAGSSFLSSQSTFLRPVHVKIVRKTVFWVVMLFFIAAASASVGLDFFATGLSTLLGYLPQIAAGLVIIVGGYFLAGLLAVMARSAAESAHMARSDLISEAVRWTVILTAAIIGIEQLGINIQFITSFLIVSTAVLLGGVALAFGLGSRAMVSNLLAAKQARKHLKLHDMLKIGDVEGRLVDITPVMLVIETEQGRTLLPASACLESAQGIAINYAGAKDKVSPAAKPSKK